MMTSKESEMSELSIFELNNDLAASDLYKSLQGTNDKLLSGSGGSTQNRRISIKGGKYRMMVNGEQVSVSKDDKMNVVIVDAAHLARTYYEGEYNADDPQPPACWSDDTQVPAKDVGEGKQSDRCMNCKQNISGSGQGKGKACRFSQRLAVVIEGELDTVYQIQLPATSVFGDPKENGGKMGLQAYAKYLQAHNTPAIAVVTEMCFDENSEVPKLSFKPIRPLSEDELQGVVALKETPEVHNAITRTVAQTDGVIAKSEAPKALFADAPKADDTPVEEPKKVVKKSAPKPTESDEELSDIVANWDD
jgi:hypothetical protein